MIVYEHLYMGRAFTAQHKIHEKEIETLMQGLQNTYLTREAEIRKELQQQQQQQQLAQLQLQQQKMMADAEMVKSEKVRMEQASEMERKRLADELDQKEQLNEIAIARIAQDSVEKKRLEDACRRALEHMQHQSMLLGKPPSR